jgi:hypothetical protein
MVKIGAFAGAGIVTFMLLKKWKKIPESVAVLAAATIMAPALMDIKDMVLAKVGAHGAAPAPQQVAYAGEELSAYVPEGGMQAWVPGNQLGDYGTTY